MLEIFTSEMLKLKRSKMLWLVLIGAFLPVLLEFVIGVHALQTQKFVQWDQMFKDVVQIMALLMCPSLFALFAGYLVAREYQERTINIFLTAPRSRIKLLLGKYLAIMPVIAATLGLTYLLVLVAGMLLRTDPLTWTIIWENAVLFLKVFITQYALVSVAVSVSLLGKTYVPAMGLGIFAVISEMTIMQSKYIMYYPWSASLNMVTNINSHNNSTMTGIIVLALIFLIPLAFNMRYILRADVHSG